MKPENIPNSQDEELINLAEAVVELRKKVAKWETIIEKVGGEPFASKRVLLN